MRRSIFQHAVALSEAGHELVLLGDYVDNGPRPNDAGFLREVFTFAQDVNATLLVGNHDLAYLYPERHDYRKSGYEPRGAKAIERVYAQFREHFRVAYKQDHIVCSHAGFSRQFVELIHGRYGVSSPAEVVNLVNADDLPETTYCGPANDGRDAIDGPMWLRLPQYDGCWQQERILQVAGHSSQSTIRFRKNLMMIDVRLPLLLEW